ncbi:MAG: hypothetical protein QOE61_3595, partial [Micromonosporaceae bacterium]|nr:hypothetical protein [Micromonosporaceae bacterium]
MSQRRALLVENLENLQEYITVEPGRRLAPIPFELARVAMADNPEAATLTVFGPEPWHIPRQPTARDARVSFRAPLDSKAIYFTVLAVLCERRQRGPPAEPLPPSQKIAEQLSSNGIRINARAVDAHLAYVAEKL